MKPLDIDLRSSQAPPRWAWAAVGVLVVMAAGLWVTELSVESRLQALRVRNSILVAQATEKPAPSALPQSAPITRYDASARLLLSQSLAGWRPLLASLESMQLQGVTPIAIDIVGSERQIRVELEFSDWASLITYLDEINAGEENGRWQIVQAQLAAHLATSVPRGTTSVATIEARW